MPDEDNLPQNNHLVTPGLITLILLLIALTQMTTDQYVPSLPAITHYFNSSESSLQLTLSFFMLGLSLSHMFYGPLSDKIGRKPPLLFGVGLSVLGSVCCVLAPSVWVLILGRFIQGFGIGCSTSVGRSLVRDLFTDRELARMGSYVGVVSIVIMASSPILGGYVQEHAGWRMNFLLLMIFGVIVWGLMFRILPETNQHKNPDATKLKVMWANYRTLLSSKVFLGYNLCASFAAAGIVAYLTIGPFLFQNTLGLSPLQFGQLTFFIAGAICLSGLMNSQLVMHYGVAVMVGVGVVMMLLGGLSLMILALFGKTQVLSIMIPVALFCVGAGFTFINAFAGAFHPFPKMAGTAGALYSSMQDLGAALISGLIAAFQGYDHVALAIILLGFGISSLLAWYCLALSDK